jgi:ATP-binding cassette subfamily C protein
MNATVRDPRPTLPVASGGQTLRGLGRALRRHPGESTASLILTILAATAMVAVPLLLGRLVDAVRSAGHRLDREVVTLLLLTGAAVALGAVLSALAQLVTERLGARVAADLREQVLVRTLGVPAPILERVGSGDVASRVTEDVENFVAAVPLAATVFSAVITVLVSAVGFATLDWRLALAFTVVFPIYWLALRSYLPAAGPLYATERRLSAERGRVLLESLHGLPTVRAYDLAELQTERVAVASRQALDTGLAGLRLFLWVSKPMNAAEAVGLSSILLVGYWLVDAEAVTVGAVTAAALLFHRLFEPLGTLLLSFDDVQGAGAALARIIGVPPVSPPSDPDRVPGGPVTIEARGVRHSYDGQRAVLEDIDLTVPAGTSLAVVGASGAGKSTLAAILAGAFAATAGSVQLLDGRPGMEGLVIGEPAPGRLRDWVGLISQETHVFTGTLRDDVTLAAPGCSDVQVRAALRTVGAGGWVAALPDGLDTRVGAGEHPLTAAQIQQLALARLVLRNPPVVVLDEATAEAGSAGARDLEAAAAALVRGRTAIVVAHRLTQARACDRIAVLDGGRIAEFGTHEELLAQKGHYCALWDAWSKR